MDDLRVLLVDDEPLVREGLRDFLQTEAGVTVVGECADGLQALAFLDRHAVDLVFLDVQMPELDGIGVAASLARGGGPAVVFVTAFSEHALRAFEVNAVDYLLKPFDRERFSAALDRVRRRRAGAGDATLTRRLTAVLEELQRGRGYAERVLVRGDGRIRFVPVEEIEWIEAADNYVRLHGAGERHLVRDTMSALEARLDPARFARIHRSAIVRLARVRELQPTFNGEYSVLMESGTRLTLSRGFRDAVLARLGER